MEIIVGIILIFTKFLYYLIFAHIILSWIRSLNPTLSQLAEMVDKLVDPIFEPFRKIVPVVDLGGMGLDLTPIVVLIFLSVINQVLLGLLP